MARSRVITAETLGSPRRDEDHAVTGALVGEEERSSRADGPVGVAVGKPEQAFFFAWHLVSQDTSRPTAPGTVTAAW